MPQKMITRKLALALAATLCVATPAAFAQEAAPTPQAAEPVSANPFFTASTLPYQLPRFDLIQDAHYAPAFERGMADQRAQVDAIANSSDAPTFDNTIVAMERTGEVLTRVSAVFFNLAS